MKRSQPASPRANVSSSKPCPSAASITSDHTHGGWIPPHDPSASCRSRTQRSATRIACRRTRREARRVATARSCARRSRSRSIALGRTGCSASTTDSDDHRLARPAGEVVDRERRPAPAAGSARRERARSRRHGHCPISARNARVKMRVRGDAAGAADVVAASRRRRPRPRASTRCTPRPSPRGPAAPRTRSTTSRRRAGARAARSRAVGPSPGSRRPRKWSRNRCSAIIVAFDSSSPFHQPSGCWSESSRSAPRSTAGRARSAPARRSCSHLSCHVGQQLLLPCGRSARRSPSSRASRSRSTRPRARHAGAKSAGRAGVRRSRDGGRRSHAARG